MLYTWPPRVKYDDVSRVVSVSSRRLGLTLTILGRGRRCARIRDGRRTVPHCAFL
jgi:hypothetical protein